MRKPGCKVDCGLSFAVECETCPKNDAQNLPCFSASYQKRQEVFGENEPATHLYAVTRGMVHATRFLADGRRQIVDFYRAGDVFGLEPAPRHHFTAEAAIGSEVVKVPRAFVETAGANSAVVAGQLWRLTAQRLERVEDHAVLLGQSTAIERVAAFLLMMPVRSGSAAEQVIDLCMSRTDMADYLGLTIETVSRALTQLEQDELIARGDKRGIVVCNRAALIATAEPAQ